MVGKTWVEPRHTPVLDVFVEAYKQAEFPECLETFPDIPKSTPLTPELEKRNGEAKKQRHAVS